MGHNQTFRSYRFAPRTNIEAPLKRQRKSTARNFTLSILYTLAARIRSNKICVPWKPRQLESPSVIEPSGTSQPDPKLVQALVRAHRWLSDLQNKKFETVEALAANVKMHPKMVRQELRYAFLAPTITQAILSGDQPATLSLARIPKTLPLVWSEQLRALRIQ